MKKLSKKERLEIEAHKQKVGALRRERVAESKVIAKQRAIEDKRRGYKMNILLALFAVAGFLFIIIACVMIGGLSKPLVFAFGEKMRKAIIIEKVNGKHKHYVYQFYDEAGESYKGEALPTRDLNIGQTIWVRQSKIFGDIHSESLQAFDNYIYTEQETVPEK